MPLHVISDTILFNGVISHIVRWQGLSKNVIFLLKIMVLKSKNRGGGGEDTIDLKPKLVLSYLKIRNK